MLLAVALISWIFADSQVEPMASGNRVSSIINAGPTVEQGRNLTIVGDIVVENGTYLIENVNLTLAGTIIASNDATVIIRNATLFATTYDIIVLTNQARFIAEKATIFVKSTASNRMSEMTLRDDTTINITDSELYGYTYMIGRENSRIYVQGSVLRGPNPSIFESYGVQTRDNSTARIQDSELDTAQAGGNSSMYINNSLMPTRSVNAGGNSLVEIEDSFIAYVDTSLQRPYNSTLRIQNSTVNSLSFRGSSLTVEDSRVTYAVEVSENSTASLTRVSASSVTAIDNATVWLINSYSGAIRTRDQGMVYVGWKLGLFGTLVIPYTWLPILQGIAALAAIAMIIALLVGLNRRWKRRQQQKLKEQVLTSSRSQIAPCV